MMVWVCPECHFKNEDVEYKFKDFRCENCLKTIDVKNIKKSYWEIKDAEGLDVICNPLWGQKAF